MDTIKPLFTATATATGGRNGLPRRAMDQCARSLPVPKAMGGPGKPNTTTPEHLFAAGYAACFGGALDFVAKQHKKDATKARITADVSIGPRDGGEIRPCRQASRRGCELAAIGAGGAGQRSARKRFCPFSHATRGNVDVQMTRRALEGAPSIQQKNERWSNWLKSKTDLP